MRLEFVGMRGKMLGWGLAWAELSQVSHPREHPRYFD